jgi:hypothetical protein
MDLFKYMIKHLCILSWHAGADIDQVKWYLIHLGEWYLFYHFWTAELGNELTKFLGTIVNQIMAELPCIEAITTNQSIAIKSFRIQLKYLFDCHIATWLGARDTHRQMPRHSVGGEGVPLGGLMRNFLNLPFLVISWSKLILFDFLSEV